MQKLFLIFLSIGLLLPPRFGVAQNNEESFDSLAWFGGMALVAIPVNAVFVYGLSRIRYPNDAVGALYLLPLVFPYPEKCETACRWSKNAEKGGWVVLSALNFSVWKNETTSKDQLLVNNLIGIAANLGLAHAVEMFGLKYNSQVQLVHVERGLGMSFQTTF